MVGYKMSNLQEIRAKFWCDAINRVEDSKIAGEEWSLTATEYADDALDEFDMRFPSEEEDTKKEDSDWIPWEGGEPPVGYYIRVEARLRDGSTAVGIAGSFSWTNESTSYDVVAYRVLPDE